MTFPLIDRDYGLGSAYERFCFYQCVDRIAREYGVQSLLEGPIDGMSGISGVHGVGLARRGVGVTSLVPSEEQREVTRAVYAAAGATADVRAVAHPRRPLRAAEVGQHDMVISYHALSSVADVPAYLAGLVGCATKVALVTVRNPDNWTVRLLQGGARLTGSRELDPPAEWSTPFLAPLLWQHGMVKEHLYFDCPWWPDLQVAPGQGWKQRLSSLVHMDVKTEYAATGATRAAKHVYTPERWPYFGGPGWNEELLPALLLHPGFDGASSTVRRYAAHLHGFVVDVRPRTPRGRRQHLLRAP